MRMLSQASSVAFHRKALAQVLALCIIMPLCALAVRPFLETLDWVQVTLAWHGITPLQWGLATLATAFSFTALGHYDVIVHRVLSTGVNAKAAQASGAAAVALSQTLGFGLIIGTLARWRGLDGLSVITASKVTALVSLSFLGAWLTLFALSGLIFSSSLPLPSIVFQASLFSAVCFGLYTVLKRYISVAGHRVRLPSLRAIFTLMCLAALDTGFAAVAFWVLIPQGADLSLSVIFPVYLMCLGASLISNTPGGVGPFELTLLWALPHANVNELLAGLIAFRLIYFALPACVAILYLLRPINAKEQTSRMTLFSRGLHPETSSGLQTGATLIAPNGQIIGATARTTQTTTLLFEPAMAIDPTIKALAHRAKTSATGALIYKCQARTALQLRKRGYAVARIAQDGLLNLSDISLDGPKRRTLRRKLRNAKKGGIKVRKLALCSESIERLNEVDRAWYSQNGTPRGLSMGRFCYGYLADQDVFGAFQNDHLVAFVSCHKGFETWTLDIMRNRANLPSGTMHALVWAAICEAREKESDWFSLASTPYERAKVLRAVESFSFLTPPHSKGLAQFKRAFAPRWQPLYAAAPTRTGLCLALWDVWHDVHDPPPLSTS